MSVLPATINWDVRVGGSDTNGGGFDSTSTGTDYSQQVAAQAAFPVNTTGLTATLASTTLTDSEARGLFTSLMVGNIFQLTAAATDGTLGFYKIVTFTDANNVVLDRAPSVVGAMTAGAGNVGGALATVGKLVNLTMTSAAQGLQPGNVIHVKAGTYATSQTSVSNPGGVTNPIQIVGYGSAHWDGGTRPLFTTATNSQPLFIHSSGGAGAYYMYKNLNFSHTAATRGVGISSAGNVNLVCGTDLFFLGCLYGLQNDNGGTGILGQSVWTNCEFASCVSGGVNMAQSPSFNSCWFHDNSGPGVLCSSGGNFASPMGFYKCVFSNNSGAGISFLTGQNGIMVSNCTFCNNPNGIDGRAQGVTISLDSSIFFASYQGLPLNLKAATVVATKVAGNAFGANAAGQISNLAYNGTTSSLGDSAITLTANPFTSSSSNNFTLNTTVGGGAGILGNAYPNFICSMGSSLPFTNYFDIGAYQAADSSAVAGASGGTQLVAGGLVFA